jgi:hypothetical protein
MLGPVSSQELVLFKRTTCILVTKMNDNISMDSAIAGSVELFEFNTILNNLINV